MSDTYTQTSDYVAPLDKLRALLGGRPMPGAVQPPPDTPVNPASLSAAQSVYGRPAPVTQPDPTAAAPTLPVQKGVTNLQPSAPMAPAEMAAPVVNATSPAPTLPWKNVLSGAPAPPFMTPEREAASKTLGTPPPTYEANKPKWWERVLGGLSAGAMAYGHVPGAVEAGQNVTNRRFNQAENAYEASRTNAKDVLGEQDKNYAAREKTWYNALTQGNREDKIAEQERHNKEVEGLTGKLRDVQQERADAYRDKQAPGPGKYANNRAAVADMKKNGVNLSKQEEKYFLVNGKLREPNPEAEARLEEARANREDRKANNDANRADREDAQGTRSAQTYNAKKADIAQREQKAFSELEDRSRDRKTGALNDPTTLENRKKQLQKQFDDEYNALGPEPARGSGKFSSQATAPSGGKTLDPSNPDHIAIAKSYLSKAGGDKDKARKLAKADGYSF